MKKLSGHHHCLFRSRPSVLLVLAGAILIFAGCSKKPSAAIPPPTNTATADDSAKLADSDHTPVNSQTAAAAVNAASNVSSDGQPDLGALNRGLLRWLAGNRRVPANFEDFAATAGIAIPPPPAGKKYIIAKNMHIQLVSQ